MTNAEMTYSIVRQGMFTQLVCLYLNKDMRIRTHIDLCMLAHSYLAS